MSTAKFDRENFEQAVVAVKNAADSGLIQEGLAQAANIVLGATDNNPLLTQIEDQFRELERNHNADLSPSYDATLELYGEFIDVAEVLARRNNRTEMKGVQNLNNVKVGDRGGLR